MLRPLRSEPYQPAAREQPEAAPEIDELPPEQPMPRPSINSGRGSYVDPHSRFSGTVQTTANLHLEGTVDGEISCDETLTVGETAVVRANISARSAIVMGRATGDVTCSERLELASSAIVEGTLKAERMVIQEGAHVKARVDVSGG